MPATEEPKSSGADADGALVDRVLAGDTRAFEELVRRHERRVFRVTLGVTGNQEDAEEAMQDAFFKAYKHLAEFQRASRFTTWLTRIAINEGLQRLRRRRDTVSLDDPDSSAEEMMPERYGEWDENPERKFARQEIRTLVEDAIRALPPPYRIAFVLRDVEEMTNEEAATALGLTVPAMKSRVLRARLMLREALAPKFERPPTLKSRVLRASAMLREALAARFRPAAGQKGRM